MKIKILLFDLRVLRAESLDMLTLSMIDVLYAQAADWFGRKKK